MEGWIFVSPTKFLCWNLVDQCDGVWRWGLGHAGGALMKGVSDLMEKTPESSLTLHRVRTQWDVSPKEGPQLTVLVPDLWHPETSSLQNHETQISVVSKPPRVFYYSSLKGPRQRVRTWKRQKVDSWCVMMWVICSTFFSFPMCAVVPRKLKVARN